MMLYKNNYKMTVRFFVLAIVFVMVMGIANIASEAHSASPVSAALGRPDIAEAVKPEMAETVSELLPPPAVETYVSDERLVASLTYLTKDIGNRLVGTNGNQAARGYIMDELRAFGYSEDNGTLYTQGLYSGGAYTENVIAVRTANVENAPIIVVSCHLDTVYGVEGSIDNGSGVALVLEAMRVAYGSTLSRDVEFRFCFFSGEEQGFNGAYAYLGSMSQAERDRHFATLNVDMAAHATSDVPKTLVLSTKGGLTPDGYAYGSFAAPQTNRVTDAANAAYVADNGGIETFYAPIHWGNNDLVPFHKYGMDAATLSWREINPSRAVTNYDIATPAYIHTYYDALENTDMVSLGVATRFAVRVMEQLANAALS